MAWRIAKYITRGELDNREKGLVTGSVWFSGKTAPIRLELHGNFLRDLAGRVVTFENPAPMPADAMALDELHVGFTGDMTASRKDTVVDMALPEESGISGNSSLPRRKVNKLFLEWFSETNGRIVIESTEFRVELGQAVWIMTAEEESQQLSANRESFRQWLEHLSELEAADEDVPIHAMNQPMNEFEWEKVFKDSDIKNERLSEVLEKYHGHPDSEMLIAREMGWMWVEEELEAQERGVFAEIDEEDEFDEDEDDDEEDNFIFDDNREPNPLREGIDWIRDDDGTIEHPLANKALRFSTSLWKYFEDAGKLSDAGDSRIFEWVGLVESAGVRLSNTLGNVAFGEDVDRGYVIAGLKRSVHIIHQALQMLQTLEPLNLMSIETAKSAQKTLFDLREDILAMMKQYRSQ